MELSESELESADQSYWLWTEGLKDPVDPLLKSIFFYNRKKLKRKIEHFHEDFLPGEIFNSGQVLYDLIPEKSSDRIRFRKSKPITILEGLRDNDRIILTDLYRDEFPAISSYICKNSGTRSQAQDVFQDALVIILEKYHNGTLDISCGFGTFLFSICRNLWFAQLRTVKITETVEKIPDQSIDIYYVDSSEQPEDYLRYAQAIEELGDKCRQLLSLYYYEHLSWDKISDMLGYSSPANARNQKYKCLEQIRKKVGK